jgi:hypothetical protein
MELTNQEKCDSLRANLIYFAERIYQTQMQIQVAKASNNFESVAINEGLLAEYLLTAKVYQDELDKLNAPDTITEAETQGQ